MTNLCLPLNATYEPLKPFSVQRAIRLVLQGKAEIIEGDEDRPVRHASGSMPRPLVIRLVKYVNIPPRLTRKVTNTMLFARDRYTCQYCGRTDRQLEKSGKREHLTRDHIQPLSRGGKNTWENCTTACSSCNWKKADCTPAEAGLRLRSQPTVPKRVELHWMVRRMTPLQAKWITAFYGEDVVKRYDSLE
jgi:5-methylcytosine-specific restriction endonuclease McrA